MNRTLIFTLFAALIVDTACAQQTITYTDGENNTASITITAPTNPTTLTIASGNATQSGAISDSGTAGQIDLTGGGTLIFTGTNTYSGGTTISSGTLQIGNGGTSGSIIGNITDNAALVFDRSDTIIFGNYVDGGLLLLSDTSGTGSLTQAGSGTLILTGGNTFTGGTIISSGTLQVGDGGVNGSLSGNILDNSALVYDLNNLSFDTASGVISGTGSLTLMGGGNPGLTLTGADTYTGGTTISGGVLQIGNGGTTGSIVGNVTDNDTLIFDRGDSVAFGGVISGTGGLFKFGNGTLTLTGDNTYTGANVNYFVVNGISYQAGTLILSGTLQIGNGGTTGSIVGDVTDGLPGGTSTTASLAFDRSDSVSFSGAIVGVGSVVQMGSGTLILTASNTYTGGTTVSSGTLLANSSNSTGSGTVTVSSGGTLGGSGTINTSGVTSGAAVTLASGATLNQSIVSGGLSTSTLTLNLHNTGATTTVDLFQGAKFAFDLGASGVSDQAVVTGGTLTLNGQNFSDFTFTVVNGFTGTGTYDLISTDASGDILGSLGNITGIVDGYNATLSVFNSQEVQVTLNGEAVPEPSTWALTLCGMILFAILRNQRGRHAFHELAWDFLGLPGGRTVDSNPCSVTTRRTH